MRKDRNDREKSSTYLEYETGLFFITILRIMRRNDLRACNLTQKSGLIEVMMKTRYHFCMWYKNWTLKNWKKIIWIDETSVILSSRRNKIRVWRTSHEVYDKICTRRRFKEFSKFMWWSSFSYDKKNFYHIWEFETAAQKKTSVMSLHRANHMSVF